ncbi:hypothetical protein BK666_07275 [Pseudomonas frederiksbergensis]|uniref:RDD domain-containing protein n=1 Tax=Pseudomonas frederiksbergensis TaxID=104087 RepID=A0A423KB80_9PSED|nr:RDD family protein [Pseudomonas frederiksbergensis]RON49369.1 hypothetical protein BK666_07275 [Pseudomonas frederiksbergensis]
MKLASEKCSQQYPRGLAAPARRLAAQTIDSAISFFLMVVIGGLLSFISLHSIASLLGMIVGGGYFLFSDGMGEGQSIGKKVMKISVVDESTISGCSYLQSFVRNFLKFFLLFLDWIFVFFGDRKRLGDMIASTVVVNMK